MQVAEAVPEFARAFPFDEFNEMQREALPALLEADDNVVASAPTASGKTALAELAICRTLCDGGTALFVAPMRALTNEKESEWERFESLGYDVYVVTGERDLTPSRAERADVLVMTPEKADSATRKHDSPRYEWVRDVDTVVVDEVHLLDSEHRGSVLEATVSRLRRLCDPRLVALSATLPNVADVAAWLDAPSECTFDFGDEYRPVDLETGVRTYTHGENEFADKYRRLYTALDLALPHVRDGGQSLVFVASRGDTQRAAAKTRDVLAERDVEVGARGDYEFHQDARALEDDDLRQSVLDGVAFHHAGLSKNDRDLVEAWFREGLVEVLFATTTLAWGVNLPARCVVIRDTKIHDPLEGEVDMSPLDVLQMLGRAGRPGYDDVGYGYVVCDRGEADKYRTLLREGTAVESRLAGDLAEHLNAEVATGTVRDLDAVTEWLETTFYYHRAQSAPDAYDFAGLRDRVRETVSDLVDRGFLEREDLDLAPTPLGRLASTFYLRLSTASDFRDLAAGLEVDAALGADPDGGDAADAAAAVLRAVAGAAEFDSVSARADEREAVETVLGRHARPGASERSPAERKVLAVLYGSMHGDVPGELRSDAWVIRQNALRLLAACRAVLDEVAGPAAANLAARLAARVEHGVPADAVGLAAIDGVGAGRATTLADAGLTTPGDVVEAGVDGLVAAGLAEGVAERVRDAATDIPRPRVEWGSFPASVPRGGNDLREVTVVNDGAGARAGVRVTVNGVEMTARDRFLDDDLAVPVGVFGADADRLDFRVSVAFPDLPLSPTVATRTVRVDPPG
ncbi:MAG: DEAD/DEAH box helicase [Halobacteriaceae archaeon]